MVPLLKSKAILRCSTGSRSKCFVAINLLRCFHDEQSMLVCGDGDLSFAASIAKDLAEKQIQLTATVLETESDHKQVYNNSVRNSRIIQDFGHSVRFDTNAARLPHYFDPHCFDRIRFNFPHWSGKANNRYNRQLLHNFFQAASLVIKPTGHVETALMKPQGGMDSRSMREWKQSWMPAVYASYSNLLLVTVEAFEPKYNLSSYRFRDDCFNLQEPQLLSFAAPGVVNRCSPLPLQMYCHFEIYLGGKFDISILQTFVSNQLASTGWCAQVYFRKWLEDGLGSYKIVLFGEREPITKEKAEKVRLQLQDALLYQDAFSFVPRGRWSVSNPCPTSMLPAYLTFIGATASEGLTLRMQSERPSQ